MRIGILTLHSQVNYGGVLQTWALQKYLQQQGYEVVVLDRRDYEFEDDICLVRDGGVSRWVKFVARMVFCLGDLSQLIRAVKTIRFINKYLHLTPYNFSSWKDAPRNLGVDRISVGSDQVWNTFNCRDGFYLLEGGPNIPAESYAASFGMHEIPEEMKSRYKEGLARFEKISVREREGVEICKALGFKAVHDCDPTMLLSKKDWEDIAGSSNSERCAKGVCYFIGLNVIDLWDELVAVSRKYQIHIDVYANSFSLPFPLSMSMERSVVNFRAWVKWHFRKRSKYLHVRASAGPIEFVKAFSRAAFVISDSFHALMFSTVFEKQVRMLKPVSKERLGMFARIEEFVTEGKNGGAAICETITQAVESMMKESHARTYT